MASPLSFKVNAEQTRLIPDFPTTNPLCQRGIALQEKGRKIKLRNGETYTINPQSLDRFLKRAVGITRISILTSDRALGQLFEQRMQVLKNKPSLEDTSLSSESLLSASRQLSDRESNSFYSAAQDLQRAQAPLDDSQITGPIFPETQRPCTQQASRDLALQNQQDDDASSDVASTYTQLDGRSFQKLFAPLIEVDKRLVPQFPRKDPQINRGIHLATALGKKVDIFIDGTLHTVSAKSLDKFLGRKAGATPLPGESAETLGELIQHLVERSECASTTIYPSEDLVFEALDNPQASRADLAERASHSVDAENRTSSAHRLVRSVSDYLPTDLLASSQSTDTEENSPGASHRFSLSKVVAISTLALGFISVVGAYYYGAFEEPPAVEPSLFDYVSSFFSW